MQRDMHYYGTYALARAAGVKADAARLIAAASAYTDDAASRDTARFPDGARLDAEATAHHAADVHNVDLEDQRNVWVPFHFLPGLEGDSYEERLVCRMDSAVAREMVDHNLAQHAQPWYLALMGVTAHVYADTFAHYGFSGISSPWNRIDNDSIRFHGLDAEMEAYVTDKAKSFWKRRYRSGRDGWWDVVKSWFAENASHALGHGAVATYPDRPYLVWEFTYQEPRRLSPLRDNPETFLAGSRALHTLFRRMLELRPDLGDGHGREFSAIEERVRAVLAVQAAMEGRLAAWDQACRAGDLTGAKEPIPAYDPDEWHGQFDAFSRLSDSRAALDPTAPTWCASCCPGTGW